MSPEKPKVGVVGSGIAGLAVTWFLGEECRVSLYEKHPSPGIDAFSTVFKENGRECRIDLPYRVIKGDFYTSLMKLYKEAGISLRRLNYAFTMADMDGNPYFGYRNLRFFNSYFPTIKLLSLKNTYNRRILKEMLRFFRFGIRQNPGQLTMNEFLAKHQFSNEFRDMFLYPIYSTINTCSMESAGKYPAASYIDYHTNGTEVGGVYHTTYGTIDAAQRLSSRAEIIRYGDPVQSVRETDNQKVEVISSNGRELYDYVVIASQANQALRFLPSDWREVTSLGKISYETSEIYTHRDPRYMPRLRKHWEPVSFIVSRDHDRPAGSLWLNALEPSLEGFADTYQSWNPLFETQPSEIINIAKFERPVLDFKALDGVKELAEMRTANKRRVFLCGSYAVPGVPLLEAGVKSAMQVAALIQN